MVFKSFIGATCACLAVVSFNSSAALIVQDLYTVGDGFLTYDESTGLTYLDIPFTNNRTYNDVAGELGVGGEFDIGVIIGSDF